MQLETEPDGRAPLVQWVAGVVRPQVNSPALRLQEREVQREQLEQRRRWEVVAAALTEALEAQGQGLRLTWLEARALAAALPAAVAEGFGGQGLGDLAAAVAELLPPPPVPDPAARLAAADGSEPFWSEWGRIAGPDEPELSDAEFWEHVWRIASGLWARPVCERPEHLLDLVMILDDARADVAAGARWDQERWDRANVASLMDCMPCDASAAELRQLLKAGSVPADLVAAVGAALSAG